jgi:amphi-Trp domain-containing protein
MPDLFESKEKLSRAGAAERLRAVADALDADGPFRFDHANKTIEVEMPEQIELEIELEVDGEETELEIEFTWPTPPGMVGSE